MLLHHLLHILNCHRVNVLFTEDEKEHMSHIPYSNVVGNLMYVMICTRPDLANVVSVVSRFMHNPSKNILECSKVDSSLLERYLAFCIII
jgi:hypothetical protein